MRYTDGENIVNVSQISYTDDDRYDITIKKHYHIVCRDCGAVADVELEFDDGDLSGRATGMEGFSVEACHLEFSGLCSDCMRKN